MIFLGRKRGVGYDGSKYNVYKDIKVFFWEISGYWKSGVKWVR